MLLSISFKTMKKLPFLILIIIVLPFELFSFPFSFEQVGEYEENAIYTDISILGTYAFLVAGNRGVHIFDVSDLTFSRKIAVVESMDEVYAMDIDGFNLYVADGMAGVRIFDIRNRKKPELISFIPTTQKALDVMVRGDYCFVAEGKGGFRLIDVSKPAFPYEIIRWNKSENVNTVEVVDEYAYLGDERGILSLLISDNPDSLNEYKRIAGLGSVNEIISDGRFLFASSNERGLFVADVSNISRASVQELSGKYAGIEDMFLSGFYLYVVQKGRIGVVNMLFPFNPYFSGTLYTNDDVAGVFVSGNLLYAACGIDGFKIYKISE